MTRELVATLVVQVIVAVVCVRLPEDTLLIVGSGGGVAVVVNVKSVLLT